MTEKGHVVQKTLWVHTVKTRVVYTGEIYPYVMKLHLIFQSVQGERMEMWGRGFVIRAK